MDNGWTRKIRFPFERREGWGDLLLLLGVSFILKVALLASTAVITNDGPSYIRDAQAVLDGDWQLVRYGAYPFLIAALSFFVSDLVFAGQLISLFASVLTLVPLYLLMQKAFSPRVAFWGCLAFIFSPGLNKFSVNVMRDPCFLLLMAFALFFAWMALNQQKLSHFLLASIFSMISILFRTEGILFPFAFFALALIFLFLEKERKKEIALGAIVFAGPYVLVGVLVFFTLDASSLHVFRSGYLAFTVENVFKHGLFDYSPLIKTKLTELKTVLPGGGNRNSFPAIAREHIRMIYFIGICSLFAKVLYVPYFYVLAFGFWMERRINKAALPLLCFFGAYWALDFNFNLRRGFLEERYIYIPIMLALPWVGIGLVHGVDFLKRHRFSRPLIALFVVIICAFPAAETFAYLNHRQTVAFKQAGEWLSRQESLKGTSLIANERKIPFYAGRSSKFTNISFLGMDKWRERIQTTNYDLISIEIGSDHVDQLPEFPGYELLVRFDDGKFTGLIFKKK